MVSGEIKNDESEAILFEVQKLWEETSFNETDLIEYDSGWVIENKHRRRTLDDPEGYLLSSEEEELNALIHRIKKPGRVL